MDKGAHFQKCDFQVHSPRDIQWTGNKYGVDPEQVENLSDEEKETISNQRQQFAKEYLQKARDKGLNAIAITDHHDFVFAKILRKVAEEENRLRSERGETENLLTVFPGVELTLVSPNCQCLLIFDADFPDQHLDSVLGIFGIV